MDRLQLERWVSIHILKAGTVVATEDFPIHCLDGVEAVKQHTDLKKFLIEVLVPLCLGGEGEVAKILVRKVNGAV